MSSVAEVRLWGRTIGAVVVEDGEEVATFQYDPQFIRSNIEVSPLTMALSNRVYSFAELPRRTFHGLPGLLADSLPDRFGNALINAWLARLGRPANSLSSVERLCYTGTRGMGALEFIPSIGPKERQAKRLEVDQLVKLASEVLSSRSSLHGLFKDSAKQQVLTDILQVGTSAGGARAKAVIAWNPKTNEVRSGQLRCPVGFQHWLIKFDGVASNRDKELADPRGYGLVEYAYHKMALDCQIIMSECRLFSETNRNHFMTRRFDRQEDGKKLHMQSLCGLAHFDFNLAGGYSYEQVFQIFRRLDLSTNSSEQFFRRMVFNIVARNQDDHVKNIAFLMDKIGNWSLAPAYDLIYSYNPDGDWTSNHQMTVNGKRDNFTMDDFRACGKVAMLKRGRAERIVKEIAEVVSRWCKYGENAGVSSPWRDQIQTSLRLQLS